MSGGAPLPGKKLGDRRVRVERPHAAYFRYAGPGSLVAKEAANVPTTFGARLWHQAKGLLLGRPLASEEEIGERLAKKKALAIFSSDAISSSAYATEEILRALLIAGVAATALGVALEVAVAIAILLGIVAFSYRQVCLAYPTGGGSYSVSKRNFGRHASLVAASALLIDYNMTVAVSTSSAVEQITSAVPELAGVNVLIGLGAIGLITLGNLRGLREAGNIFALPTYLFLASALLMIGIGVYRIVVLGDGSEPSPAEVAAAGHAVQDVGLIVLLRAFASGAVALTGTEAIATGVPAFKPPESRNAATTLMLMAGILATLFVGITFVATRYGVVPLDGPASQTVIAQVASKVYGTNSIGFFLFQGFTALLLFLAANTSFAAFPRLAALLAEDGFFPRQFAFRGDRLAFSTGIIALGLVAGTLVFLFRGDTHALIPLYAVGVFIDFTISQAGMIRHWRRTRDPGWRRRLTINTIGCVATAVVAVVVTSIKFAGGAYLVVGLIPVLVILMLFVRHEYDAQSHELFVREDLVVARPHREQRVIVPVNGINRSVIQAVNFGRTMSEDLRAIYVATDAADAEDLRRRWSHQIPGVTLVVVESPYRALIGPVVAYLDVLEKAWPADKEAPITIVVLPEYVARHWWDRVLYNQTARRLKAALVGRERLVIADVPYRRGKDRSPDEQRRSPLDP